MLQESQIPEATGYESLLSEEEVNVAWDSLCRLAKEQSENLYLEKVRQGDVTFSEADELFRPFIPQVISDSEAELESIISQISCANELIDLLARFYTLATLNDESHDLINLILYFEEAETSPQSLKSLRIIRTEKVHEMFKRLFLGRRFPDELYYEILDITPRSTADMVNTVLTSQNVTATLDEIVQQMDLAGEGYHRNLMWLVQKAIDAYDHGNHNQLQSLGLVVSNGNTSPRRRLQQLLISLTRGRPERLELTNNSDSN